MSELFPFAERELPPLNAFLRDRACLLFAADRASEMLEERCSNATGPTITLTVDELRELAEQFGRVTSLLTVIHLSEARAAKERAQAA